MILLLHRKYLWIFIWFFFQPKTNQTINCHHLHSLLRSFVDFQTLKQFNNADGRNMLQPNDFVGIQCHAIISIRRALCINFEHSGDRLHASKNKSGCGLWFHNFDVLPAAILFHGQRGWFDAVLSSRLCNQRFQCYFSVCHGSISNGHKNHCVRNCKRCGPFFGSDSSHFYAGEQKSLLKFLNAPSLLSRRKNYHQFMKTRLAFECMYMYSGGSRGRLRWSPS